MNRPVKIIILWSPRILCIIIAVFFSLIAIIDAYHECYGMQTINIIIDTFIYLIPTIVILVVLILSWRWEWIGSVVFLGFGIYLIFKNGIPDEFFFIIIYFIQPLTGILFLISWFNHDKLRMKEEKEETVQEITQ